ncbi:MAG: hypothetical protein JJ877_08330 [Thalassococcus sp.]|uniref:hypothetical protein n=1 Tax=Thalassococcus sp. TaxID=1928858 RepID=UPI001B0C83D5|nr:hypothetical protein [Thalassococcus sp.]MBO6867037.1 hypothetical protein [Thalassococcus sp.]
MELAKLSGITVGAIGAAIVAGFISLIGMIIGKEQKVSEFRQAWINDLRQCLSDYLVSVNAICDLTRLKNAGRAIDDAQLVENLKELNKANHGIILRINSEEDVSKALISAMEEFDILAASKNKFHPDEIKKVEEKYISGAKSLLKYEWRRVKKGEPIFYLTKYAAFVALAILVVVFFIKFFENGVELPIAGSEAREQTSPVKE